MILVSTVIFTLFVFVIDVLLKVPVCFKPGRRGYNMDKKPIILVIDDDPTVLNTVVSILKDDYSVRPLTSGSMALSFLETHQADLILLDQHMPDMSGFEVLEKLQANSEIAATPVIFHTADCEGDSEVAALEMGAVDYIRKPVRPQILLTRVRLQLELQAHRKNLEQLVAEKTLYLNEAYSKLKAREEMTLDLLAKVTDMRDQKTGDHVERTTKLVRVMVEYLLAHPKEGYVLSREEADEIISSSKLHDLGKIALPDKILLKEGILTDEEFACIKKHPISGGELLSEFNRRMDDSFLTTARDIALYHHEKWNGSGYPRGLKGVAIPLSARIAAIADVYDALTSDRPYKEAYSHDKAIAIILSESGTHFDPYLVEVFEKCEKEFAITAVRYGDKSCCDAADKGEGHE